MSKQRQTKKVFGLHDLVWVGLWCRCFCKVFLASHSNPWKQLIFRCLSRAMPVLCPKHVETEAGVEGFLATRSSLSECFRCFSRAMPVLCPKHVETGGQRLFLARRSCFNDFFVLFWRLLWHRTQPLESKVLLDIFRYTKPTNPPRPPLFRHGLNVFTGLSAMPEKTQNMSQQRRMRCVECYDQKYPKIKSPGDKGNSRIHDISFTHMLP